MREIVLKLIFYGLCIIIMGTVIKFYVAQIKTLWLSDGIDGHTPLKNVPEYKFVYE